MRKLAILVGAIALTGSSFAQKATSDTPMSLEGQVGFNTSTLSFSSPAIRFRYFVTENIAVRATLGMSFGTTNEMFYEDEALNSGGEGTYTEKSSSWNLAVGAEYHFAGTDRLSPYAGLDIGFGGGSDSYMGENSDGSSYVADFSMEGKDPMSMIGVNLVAGTDFYFAENFYLGLELGLGFGSTTWKEGTSSVTFGGTTTDGPVSNTYKSSSFSNNFISNFRLGWRF
ncbi:MAG: outer membrane beta-barrel protein [Bacteroidota bacterium]